MGPVLWSGHGVGLRRGTEPDAGGVGVGRGRPRDVRAQRRRETIPAELVAAMRRADDFGKGYDARTQMFYAALSYDFHVNETDDLTARLTELMRRYSVFPYIEGTHMQCHSGTSTATAPATTPTCGPSSSRRTCSPPSTGRASSTPGSPVPTGTRSSPRGWAARRRPRRGLPRPPYTFDACGLARRVRDGMRVTALTLYPVKSLEGVAVTRRRSMRAVCVATAAGASWMRPGGKVTAVRSKGRRPERRAGRADRFGRNPAARQGGRLHRRLGTT